MNGNQLPLHIRAVERFKNFPSKRGAVLNSEVKPAGSLFKRCKSMCIKYKKIPMGTEERMTVLDFLGVVADIVIGPHQVVIKNV